ncbi:unnamed protein product [Toxocara canis]|uniref:Cytochrome P450 2C8 n=1 Tax=Toxocara canis TaxID=6265 RepID=A0A183UL91_TOXCA|nr:unnamed protein product [Toxocara canis]
MILVSFVVLMILFCLLNYYRDVKRYPKGPTPLPLIGNLHQMESYNMHLHFEKLSKVYGPVFTVFLPIPTVVITQFQPIKEAFLNKGNDFAGRFGGYPDNMFQNIENGGVIFSQGENWVEQRRTSLRILRDLGMGKRIMEERVMKSVYELLNQLENEPDKDHVDFRWPLQLCVANVITEILFGYHHDYSDCSKLKHFVEIVRCVIEYQASRKLIYLTQQFWFIAKIPIINRFGLRKMDNEAAKVKKYIRQEVDKHSKQFDSNSEPQTFIHAYLREMTKDNKFLCYEQLINVVADFWLAGMETTTTTLRWAILLMVTHSDVQEKMREEIFGVVGKERYACMADKVNMPYCSAVIMEVQRVANILPFNVLHRTVCETTIGNHRIPKDTLVLGQITTVLSSTSVFENPEEFQPMRFLDKDGKTFRKEMVEHLIPFSIGKRQCAGASLARVELFLVLVNLLQNYRLEVPSDGDLPNLEPICGGLSLPRSYRAKIVCLH